MSEVSIKVNIAGRTYPLTVDQQDHEQILQAEQSIEESIQQFRQSYAVKDKHDLLEFAELPLTARKNSLVPQESAPDADQLVKLESLLDSYLS